MRARLLATLTLATFLPTGLFGQSGVQNGASPKHEALSANHPTVGVAVDRGGGRSVQFNCNTTENAHEIRCDFSEISVTKELGPEKREKFISDAASNFRQVEKSSHDVACKLEDSVVKSLTSVDTTEVEKDHFRRLADTLSDICKKKVTNGIARYAEELADIKTHTCQLFTISYSSIFKEVSSDGKRAWVYLKDGDQVGVLGKAIDRTCGLVNLDRFEPNTTGDSSVIQLWDYHTRSVVSNPGGKYSVFQCDKEEEPDTKWEEGSTTIGMGCDFIKFGP